MSYILILCSLVLLTAGFFCLDKEYKLITSNKNKYNWLIAAFLKIAAISIPAGTVCISACIIGNSGILTGILLGTAMFMLLVVVGKIFLTDGNIFDRREIDNLSVSLSYAVFVTALLLYLSGNYLSRENIKNNQITWNEGLILIILFMAYMLLQLINIIKICRYQNTGFLTVLKDIMGYIRKEIISIRNILLFIFSIVLTATGAILVTVSSYQVAAEMGISQNIFSVFINVIIVNMPVVVICNKMFCTGAGNILYDVSGIISVSCNLLILMTGIASVICGSIKITIYNIYDILFLALSYLIVWICIKIQRISIRLVGCLMITLYIGYIVFVFNL